MMVTRLVQKLKNRPPLGWPGYRTTPIIGLDLGSQAITFVELRKQQDRLMLERWGRREIDAHVIEYGRIKQRSRLLEALSSLVKEYKLEGAAVAVAVNGASVMIRRVHVPKCHQHHLDEYVMWEGSQLIPYDPDEVYLDYALCSPDFSSSMTHQDLDLLLIASKREAVDERREVLEESHLNPVICDVEGLALFNLISIHQDVQPYRSYLLVHIQNSMMNVTVIAHNQPLLVRDVSVSIAGHTHVGHDMSEHVENPRKEECWHDIQTHDPVLSEEVWEVEVVGELKRTLDGARECQADLDVEKIFLSSSLSISLEFLERLRQSIPVPVSFIDPFLPLERKKSQKGFSPLSPSAGIAGGLALRGVFG